MNESNRRVALLLDAVGDGLVDRAYKFHAGNALLFVAETRGVQIDGTDAHRLELHFCLPLVDLGEGLGLEHRQEVFGTDVDELGLGFAEFRRTKAFGTF